MDIGYCQRDTYESAYVLLRLIVIRGYALQSQLRFTGVELCPAHLITSKRRGDAEGFGVETQRSLPIGYKYAYHEKFEIHFE